MVFLRPLSCLLPQESPRISLIILNQPIEVPLFKILWEKSLLKAVTDGAANRLLERFKETKSSFTPDFISGDFDSATKTSLDFFREKKVEIIQTPDQDETDFTKCLRLVTQRMDKSETDCIVAIGAFGGRFDHCLANVNTLYTAIELTNKPLLLFSQGSMACLLDKGSHEIEVDTGYEDDWCGLIPVGKPATNVTTTGLKYNLNGDGMQFGDLISTSNSIADKKVTVSTDAPLLWVMGYRHENL